MIDTKLAFVILAVCFVLFTPPAFAQEKTGTLEVFIKNENNDRVTPEGVSVKIYKDLEKNPLQQIPALENNPFTITSLPLGNRYKVEVYVNNLYADVGFVDLQKNQQHLDITIKNMGGMRLNIFYSDGETPLPAAKVWIKSHDGKSWSYSETDENGQTIRTWLYPSIKEGNYYFAEILISPNLKHVYSPIKLQPNIAQEFKVVTKWPTIIDKLITIEVYNSTKAKVTKQDGTFIAQLFDVKKNKVAESTVTDKGLAHFSNLKVNDYALYIKTEDGKQLKTVAAKKVTITDTINTIKIYLNNPELNSDHLNCDCVAFRLDDIQDFYLAPAQISIISLFEEKNTPLTIGIIGSVVGTDQKLISTIKTGLVSNAPIEIASHSWNNRVLATLSKSDQESLIKQANEKIKTIFGQQPTVFIPPENRFDNTTLSILSDNGFTHISYSVSEAEPPLFKKSNFYHFPILPATARLDASTGIWHHYSTEKIFDDIEQSIFDYGYAVVMMHPYEFSMYENAGYVNKVNTTKINELKSLIDKVYSRNLKILPIGSIQDYDKPVGKSQPDTKPGITNCNCVAFRLDNVQDFWLNDVQNTVLDTFDKKGVPLTISVLGKFIGDDTKAVTHIKEKVKNKPDQLRLANRGWEYVDHTEYDLQKQLASIKQTNDKISAVFGSRAVIFAPPYDAFNKNTIEAIKQTKMIYFSSSITNDQQPFPADSLRHVPATVSFANLSGDDPFLSGTMQQKALTKVQASIKQHGFAVISLHPPDFAVKTDVVENKVDADKIKLLESLIDDIRSSGLDVVTLERVPALLDDKSIIIPGWIKDNAASWSEGKITDSDFTKGLEYLIDQNIIKIPNAQTGVSEQKIPLWVKNNASWWSEGKISNADFVKGIQYLIERGIVIV